MAAATHPVHSIPQLDLKPYPAPGPDEVRWVIQLPGVVQPSQDSELSSNPKDWRVELIVGREMAIDCNRQLLQGRINSESVPGWGYTLYRVSGGERAISTLMACPPNQAPRRDFVPLGGEPTLVPYNASLPIVIYTPESLQVRWRIWKAQSAHREAMKLSPRKDQH